MESNGCCCPYLRNVLILRTECYSKRKRADQTSARLNLAFQREQFRNPIFQTLRNAMLRSTKVALHTVEQVYKSGLSVCATLDDLHGNEAVDCKHDASNYTKSSPQIQHILMTLLRITIIFLLPLSIYNLYALDVCILKEPTP